MADEIEPPELGRLRDTSTLWRVSTWGGAATLALAATVLIAQTDIGAERLRMALMPGTSPAPRVIAQTDIAPPADSKEVQARQLETKRLEAQVRQLVADRDQLTARVASLESNLNDMTGSIKRQLAQLAPAPPAPRPTADAPLVAAPQTTIAAAVTADSAGPMSSTVQTPSDSRVTRSQATFESKIDVSAMPKSEADAPIPAEPASRAAAPLPEPVPLPPTRVASVSTADPAAAAPRKAELGIDLGGARTMEILHQRWAAVKANFGPMLEGMQPLVVQDRRPGIIPYRLIVGPIPNGATAAAMCTRFAASRVTCRTTKFVGEQLAQQQ